MKFLADENIARRIVQWLRERGEDVLFAAAEKAGEVDPEWLRQAQVQERLLLRRELEALWAARTDA